MLSGAAASRPLSGEGKRSRSAEARSAKGCGFAAGIGGPRSRTDRLARTVAIAVALASATISSLPATAAAATAVSWGSNQLGGLGDGQTFAEQNYSASPVVVSGLSDVIAVAHGGDFSLALTADGSVWTWGANNRSQLGDGQGGHEGESSDVPVEVCSGEGESCPNHLSEVAAIAVGDQTAYALKRDGSVYSWGYGLQGQLGDGYAFAAQPHRVLSGASAIAGGPQDGYAVLNDGKVYSWGLDDEGQLGRQIQVAAPQRLPAKSKG